MSTSAPSRRTLQESIARGTCSYQFAGNASITLTETPATHYTFSSWSGGCSGSNSACTLTLTANTTVTTTFTVDLPTLTVAVANCGTVTSSPSGINCVGPATCWATFTSGTSITLSQSPTSGFSFTSWLGGSGCNGSGSCSFTLNADRTVTAIFNNSEPGTSKINGTTKMSGKNKLD